METCGLVFVKGKPSRFEDFLRERIFVYISMGFVAMFIRYTATRHPRALIFRFDTANVSRLLQNFQNISEYTKKQEILQK